jgi:hypothetical protein
MSLLKKICITMFVYSLVACGDSDQSAPDAVAPALQESMQQEQEIKTMNVNSHTIQGMKGALDDARGVESMLQEQADERQKKIDEMLKR